MKQEHKIAETENYFKKIETHEFSFLYDKIQGYIYP